MRRLLACLIFALLLGTALLGTASTRAAEPGDSLLPTTPLRVGVMVTAPFVTLSSSGTYGGMAIDLWQDVAGRLGLTSNYQSFTSFKALMDAVASGKLDIAVSNSTITRGRLERMDFTQPWFDAGLRVMINTDRPQGLRALFHDLWVSGHVKVYALMVCAVLFGTLCLTLIDRRFDEEFPRSWWRGFAESFYHVMSIATSGKAGSHKSLFGGWGRLLAALWMVCGVAVVAYVTSSITSVMTAATIAGQITSVADLPGKTVGVVEGSVGEDYAVDAVLSSRSYPTFEAAVEALLHGQIAAIVDDAPTLEYFDHTHPGLPLSEVGAIFRPAKYGFALPRGSSLTHPISVQILADEENGFLDKLRARYFGIQP